MGGILSALIVGLLLLFRSKKPEPKWLFVMGLLEVCAENLYVQDELTRRGRRQLLGSEGRSNS